MKYDLEVAADILLRELKSRPERVPELLTPFTLPADCDKGVIATDPETGIQVMLVIRLGDLTLHKGRPAPPQRTERRRPRETAPMTDEQRHDAMLWMERDIFRRTQEGRSLARMRNRWPFPEPVPAHKRPTLETPAPPDGRGIVPAL